LCPFCAKGNRAFIEDELHVCFDCPLYSGLRANMVYELQGTNPPCVMVGQVCASEALRALGLLLNPQCRASARAVARFAFEALQLRASMFLALDQFDYGKLDLSVWQRSALVEWTGVVMPFPTVVTFGVIDSLLPPTDADVRRSLLKAQSTSGEMIYRHRDLEEATL